MPAAAATGRGQPPSNCRRELVTLAPADVLLCVGGIAQYVVRRDGVVQAPYGLTEYGAAVDLAIGLDELPAQLNVPSR